jgi:hypothetical protein
MPNSFPAPQQNLVANPQTNRTLLNNLNIFDRSFEKQLVRIYGAENYAMVQMALGNTVMETKSDNRQFYHYEKTGLHAALKVATNVTGQTAGTEFTVTVDAASVVNNQIPARVGEVLRLMTSGLECQVTATINSAAAGSSNSGIAYNQFKAKPVQTTGVIASSGQASTVLAGDYFLLRGAVNIGEQSTVLDSLDPLINKIFNTTTEHRDDFTITDRASLEKNEVDFGNGNFYYYYLGMDDMNKRYMNNAFFKIMEGVAVDNITGTVGTTGVIPRVQANGSTIQYSAGAASLADIHTVTRTLNFYGGAGEYHWLQDIYQRQEINDLLFGKYTNGAINYGSVGENAEVAASYGFKSFSIDGFTFHFYLNNMFSPEAVYQIAPGTLVPEKRNYGLLIPQKINSDAKTGKQFPSYQIVFQDVNGQRILTTETGMLAPQNKTTTANKTISLLSYCGCRVFAANQYIIFKGV